VTNSTTEIGTVQLLSGTKCKIITTGHEGAYGVVEVWLLSLSYKPVTAVLNFTPRPLCFSTKHKPGYGGVEV